MPSPSRSTAVRLPPKAASPWGAERHGPALSRCSRWPYQMQMRVEVPTGVVKPSSMIWMRRGDGERGVPARELGADRRA